MAIALSLPLNVSLFPHHHPPPQSALGSPEQRKLSQRYPSMADRSTTSRHAARSRAAPYYRGKPTKRDPSPGRQGKGPVCASIVRKNPRTDSQRQLALLSDLWHFIRSPWGQQPNTDASEAVEDGTSCLRDTVPAAQALYQRAIDVSSTLFLAHVSWPASLTIGQTSRWTSRPPSLQRSHLHWHPHLHPRHSPLNISRHHWMCCHNRMRRPRISLQRPLRPHNNHNPWPRPRPPPWPPRGHDV